MDDKKACVTCGEQSQVQLASDTVDSVWYCLNDVPEGYILTGETSARVYAVEGGTLPEPTSAPIDVPLGEDS